MTNTLRNALLAVALVAAPAATQAATISFSNLPGAAIMNPTATSSSGTYHENVTGSAWDRRSVWQETGVDVGVQADGKDSYYSSLSQGAWAVFSTGLAKSLTFAWGSPDVYNKVEFLLNGTVVDTVALLSGDNIAPATWSANGALASISDIAGGMFDAIRLSSTGTAFEFANLSAQPVAPVPLPAAGLLLLSAFGGVAVARRRASA